MNQVFKLKSHITGDSVSIVYMIKDKVCDNIFYIGYTEDNMKVRWRLAQPQIAHHDE
jgi:predicted GIY-YIG superfamily endonuclease